MATAGAVATIPNLKLSSTLTDPVPGFVSTRSLPPPRPEIVDPSTFTVCTVKEVVVHTATSSLSKVNVKLLSPPSKSASLIIKEESASSVIPATILLS